MKTARGGQYVPSLFFLLWKFTAVLIPIEASIAAISVVGICTNKSNPSVSCMHQPPVF